MPEVKKVVAAGPQTAKMIEDVPSLALFTSTTGNAIQIPPGAVLAIVEDRKNPERIFTWVLREVRHDRLKFQCACGRPGCTRTATFKAIFKGVHPSREGAVAQ